jgi:hypothetical protein
VTLRFKNGVVLALPFNWYVSLLTVTFPVTIDAWHKSIDAGTRKLPAEGNSQVNDSKEVKPIMVFVAFAIHQLPSSG